MKRVIALFTFYKRFLRHPRTMGAFWPSSQWLAQEMARHVALSAQGIVVELGAGTGVVTKALLAHGVSPHHLWVIEYASEFVRQLRRRFPTVRIIQGDAAKLSALLMHTEEPVGTIVSSLPLRSLPQQKTQDILKEVSTTLMEGGLYIQFTYSFCQKSPALPSHFKLIERKRIWRNLPPARVDVFQKTKE